MRSIANRHGKRKRLGETTDWSAIDFHTQPMDTKVELIRALIPLGLMAVHRDAAQPKRGVPEWR